MQFSDTTNKNGLIQDIERKTGLGDGTISSNPQKLKEFTGRINNWLSRAVYVLIRSDNKWQWTDSNDPQYNYATTALFQDVAEYRIEPEWLIIHNVQIKDTSGNWITLEQVEPNQERTSLEDRYRVSGQPIYYDLVGDVIKLFPAPNYGQNASLKVTYQKTPIYFVYGDTTKEAPFPVIFHEYLSLGASYDYCVERQKQPAQVYRQELDIIEKRMSEFYTKRNPTEKTFIRPLITPSY